MEKTITCINCPVGCRMTVQLNENGHFLSVSGNTCPRGAKYAEQECTMPMRTITAVVPVAGMEVPVSVKTSQPVPKSMIRSIMKSLSLLSVAPPVRLGQVIVHDILGTGADIISTRNIEKT